MKKQFCLKTLLSKKNILSDSLKIITGIKFINVFKVESY